MSHIAASSPRQNTTLSTVWQAPGYLWLTLPVFMGTFVVAFAGLFSPDVYANSLSFAAQGQAQDLVTLVWVLPLLLISALLTARHSASGLVLWLGAMLYIAYTYAIAAFQVLFNDFFLLYVLNLGVAFYAIIWALLADGVRGVRVKPTAPVRVTVIVMLVFVALYYSLWLADVVTAIRTNTIPPAVAADNIPTSAVEVLDMGFYLPLLLIGAVMLWRRQSLAVPVAGMALAFAPLMGVAVIAMIINMARLGVIEGTVPQIVVFGATVALTASVLVRLLRHVEWTEGSTRGKS